MGMDETIREALLRASSLFIDAGIEEGRHEAELLLMHLLGWDRSRLLLDGAQARFPANEGISDRWQEMLRRRIAGEPVQYIIGEQEFYGLTFAVNPAVLIPRPETELLVEATAKQLSRLREAVKEKADRPFTIADIGTGSGAIAVTLAKLLPDSRITACDLSADALAIASRNAARNGVADRIALYQGNLLTPLIDAAIHVDALVSNPPYIPSLVIADLQREVRDHEPHLALDGGSDGLDCYREIITRLPDLPQIPQYIGFEVGIHQARDVAAMLEQTGYWRDIEIVRDYAGIERHVLGL